MPASVLCIDDEPAVLTACEYFLKADYAVTTVTSCAEALALLASRGPFAVVVSDLHMPEMNGIQFLNVINELYPDTVRVLMTGHLDLESALRAVNDGHVFRCLTKPWSAAALRGAVAAGVAQYELIVSDRRRVEETLRTASAQLAEQNEPAALRAEVGLALNRDRSLGEVLHDCCDAILRHTGAAFVRVWTLNEAERVLELRASVGQYTRTDGPHARVPVGEFKIGRIAASGTPHLTNTVPTDQQIGDPEWAAREGMVAFAGHPLIVAERVVGVLALFARHALSDHVLHALKVTADALALGIVRKRTETALRASEERYRQLFDSNPHAMWVYDVETLRFLAVNDAAVWQYGYSRDEFLTMTVSDVTFDAPELGRAPEFARAGVPHRYRHKSGEVRQVEVAANPIDFGGRAAQLVLIVDVTERKLLEDQLKQAQKLESIGQLAAGIAHEINTPVQYIGDNANFLAGAFRDVGAVLGRYRAVGSDPGARAEAERAAEEVDLDYLLDEAPRAIAQTLEGVKHVARIVKAMKEFAHPGTDEKVPIDLNHAIETVIAVARNEWKYTADVTTDLDPNLPAVEGLAGELNQVFLNLLVNAAHAVQSAHRSDGAKGQITFATRRSGNVVEVRVADTGCGIPEAIRGRIFDPFFTTKPVGQGTGQGLSIAHAVVVKRHGGALAFESEVGKGTTFVVRLPVQGAKLTRSEFVKTVSAQRKLPAAEGSA